VESNSSYLRRHSAPPSGHSHTHESASKIKLENYDQHDDDVANTCNEDGDNDDIQEVSGPAFLPSLRSQLSVSTINRARSKAIQRDANQKALDKSKGAYGIRPANDNLIRKTIIIWPCERPPAKPQQLGVSIVKKLDPSLKLHTASSVDQFVRSLISSFPAVQDHKDISSGELKISDSRLAYIIYWEVRRECLRLVSDLGRTRVS
jgi:hypothetical protein